METSRSFFTVLRVGYFFAVRQLKRSSKWTTVLIISIMTLTFLNLVVVSGVLVGLIQGSVDAVKSHYTGDVVISNLKEKEYILRSPFALAVAKGAPGVQSLSARYIEGGTIEANYKTKLRATDIDQIAATSVAGIDPVAEDETTGLSKLLIEGEYLSPTDYDQVLIGAMLLKKYLDIESPGFVTLENVGIGTKVRVEVGGHTREVTVKGIVKSKVDEIDRRVFFVDSQLRSIIGRNDFNVDEISIKLKPGANPVVVRDYIIGSGVGDYARVQTFEEGMPKFLVDIQNTFAMLGTLISSVGLIVALITIFIVIFINAVTRRKYIGILKGIGIESRAIEISYIFQSIFYALVGSAIGLAFLYGFLMPYVARHPIDFPFSDGIIVAPLSSTLIRVVVLLVTTIIAAYIPARMIVKRNTLDAILGR